MGTVTRLHQRPNISINTSEYSLENGRTAQDMQRATKTDKVVPYDLFAKKQIAQRANNYFETVFLRGLGLGKDIDGVFEKNVLDALVSRLLYAADLNGGDKEIALNRMADAYADWYGPALQNVKAQIDFNASVFDPPNIESRVLTFDRTTGKKFTKDEFKARVQETKSALHLMPNSASIAFPVFEHYIDVKYGGSEMVQTQVHNSPFTEEDGAFQAFIDARFQAVLNEFEALLKKHTGQNV